MKKIYRTLLMAITLFALIGCGGGNIGEEIADSIANGVFVSNEVITIPDNDDVGISSPIAVESRITSLTKMEVIVSIEHTNVGVLGVYLKSPAGTMIPLSVHHGGHGHNFYPTFKDDADESIADIRTSNEPFEDKYRPDNPLSSFNGENPNGEWKLIVYDDSAGETGKLKGWDLLISGDE